MKKLLVVSIFILSIFLIYLSTIDKKVYYLSLSTNIKENNYAFKVKQNMERKGLLEKYVFQFNQSNFRITDFIKMIEENKTIRINNKEQSIKNALIKADVLSIDVGRVDLFTEFAYEKDMEVLYNYTDEIMNDMDHLLNLIRLYCKEDIFLLQIYNPKNLFPQDIIDYMNSKLKVAAKKYKINFVSYEIKNNMIQNTIDLNGVGEQEIFKKLNAQIENTLFHK